MVPKADATNEIRENCPPPALQNPTAFSGLRKHFMTSLVAVGDVGTIKKGFPRKHVKFCLNKSKKFTNKTT